MFQVRIDKILFISLLALILGAGYVLTKPIFKIKDTCGEFKNSEQARKAFTRNPQKLGRMDSDKDGIACE